MKVEAPTYETLAYGVGLVKELVDAGAFSAVPGFDWDYTLQMGQRLMDNAAYCLRIGFDDDDKPAGILVGHVIPFYFNPAVGAYEDLWFVREGTPGRTRLGIMLMRNFVHWAFYNKGAIMVQTGDIAAIEPLGVDALYRHMGFRRFGTIYRIDRSV